MLEAERKVLKVCWEFVHFFKKFRTNRSDSEWLSDGSVIMNSSFNGEVWNKEQYKMGGSDGQWRQMCGARTNRCTERWGGVCALGGGGGVWDDGWLRGLRADCGWVRDRHTHRERASRPPKWQSVRNLRVFAADPYTLAQHFLNLSSVFSGHKWISSLPLFFFHTLYLLRCYHHTKNTHTDTHTSIWIHMHTNIPFTSITYDSCLCCSANKECVWRHRFSVWGNNPCNIPRTHLH